MMHRDDIHGDDIADEFAPPPPDKRYAHHRWQLSAMLDGELSPDEAKFMLRRLQHDSALAACWERWQVGGDVLRGRGHALLPADFSRRVARAIAHSDVGEAVPELQPAFRARNGRWGGRAALAASVAVAALFVARQLPGDGVPTGSGTPGGVVATAPVQLPAESVPDAGASFAAAASALAAAGAVAERRTRTQAQATQMQDAQEHGIVRRGPPRSVAQQPPAAQPPMIVAASQQLQAAELPATLALPRTNPADPFAALAIAPPRPWPRAILPQLASAGSLATRFGEGAAGSVFHPFEPRLQPRATTSASEEANSLSDIDGQSGTQSPDGPGDTP